MIKRLLFVLIAIALINCTNETDAQSNARSEWIDKTFCEDVWNDNMFIQKHKDHENYLYVPGLTFPTCKHVTEPLIYNGVRLGEIESSFTSANNCPAFVQQITFVDNIYELSGLTVADAFLNYISSVEQKLYDDFGRPTQREKDSDHFTPVIVYDAYFEKQYRYIIATELDGNTGTVNFMLMRG